MQAFFRFVYIAGRAYRDGGITILSYHSIDNHGTPLSVSPRHFAAQMKTVANEGCPTFTMSDVAKHLSQSRPFPPRAVAVTFDDGFASVVGEAVPMLRHLGIKATVFIITGMVGRRTDWTDRGQTLPSLPLLTWEQIEGLRDAGIEIGAHSITHGFLTQYADAELQEELEGPKSLLQERLGVPAAVLAYPQGDYDIRVVRAADAAGYYAAVTVDQGRATLRNNPLALPRLLVSDNTALPTFRAFTVPSVGPAYRLINLIVRGAMGRKKWPRRQPGEVDSTGSLPLESGAS
jgi:peptidoglycan/xylan/chitin deacetylase (PgdA/CDA1 family)